MAAMNVCPNCGRKGWHQPRLQMQPEGTTYLRCRYCYKHIVVSDEEALSAFLHPERYVKDDNNGSLEG